MEVEEKVINKSEWYWIESLFNTIPAIQHQPTSYRAGKCVLLVKSS